MLVDDVVQAGPMGYRPKAMAAVMERVRDAQKYVLDPPFAAAADALSADYGSLVKAFPFCRLPFAETWIEVAQSDRPQFLAAGIHAPKFQSRPRRVGFLCSATRPDLSAWKAHIFWSMENGCGTTTRAMQFDMTQGDGVEYDLTSHTLGATNREFFPNVTPGGHPGWRGANTSVKQAIMQHTHPIAPDFGIPVLPHELLEMGRHEREKVLSVLADLSRSDWSGEVGYLLAVIGLLNARNAIERERVDVTKKNRARIKRGRPPFFEHHILKIHRLQVKRAAGTGDGSTHGPVRYHICAGHWKVRKTGLFFWRPHWRGDWKRGTVTKTYEVAD